MLNNTIIFLKKNFFSTFIFFYFLIGAFYSLQTGLTFDEWIEQHIWEYNIALIKSNLFNIELKPEYIYLDQPKYYGIGFQLISQPIQHILEGTVLKLNNITELGAHLVAKHFVVFSFFLLSGIFFYLIISKIINNSFFCKISTILYLVYPYLLGHSMFNPKDIPFLCVWLICTYVSINIFDKLTKEIFLKYRDVILISIVTAFLISIRVSGILIFIQYLITLIIFLSVEKVRFIYFLKLTYKKILFFTLLTILLIYSSYPIIWKNPLVFIEAVNTMSNYFNNVCTLTLGKCIFSKDLDPLYVPIWLLVKLPTIILVGLILLPFTEKKIFISKTRNIAFGTILLSSFLIPVILIAKKVNLYDEIRQILFLVPLIFIVGISSLYIFSKKIFYFLSFLSLILFSIESVKIHPYQYAWFNMPSRFLNLPKNFEIDYWGVSSKDLATNIIKLTDQNIKNSCVLGPWFFEYYLDPKTYKCFGPFGEVNSDMNEDTVKRPFLAGQNIRNLKRGKIYGCDEVYVSKFKFLFSNQEIVTGKILKCT